MTSEGLGKIKEKQTLMLGGVSITSLMIFLLILLTTNFFRDNSEVVSREKALLGAESFAYQLLQIEKNSFSTRGPASVAPDVTTTSQPRKSIQKDPWGNPYNFKEIIKENKKAIFVWSSGKNKIDESALDLEIKGDDIGTIISE